MNPARRTAQDDSKRSRLRAARLLSRGINPASVTHGTFSGGMVRCKCWECYPWHPVLHGTLQGYDSGCRCDPCRVAKVAVVNQWRQCDPDRLREHSARWSRSAVKQNSESLATAVNHRKQWTSTELQLLARRDISRKELARRLGRTIKAIDQARKKLNTDPAALERGFVSGGRRKRA